MALTYSNRNVYPSQCLPTQAICKPGQAWCGVVAVTSVANNLVTVSCAMLTNSDVVFLTTRVLGVETVDFSGFAVTSVNVGNGFSIGPVASRGPLVSSYMVAWSLLRLAS